MKLKDGKGFLKKLKKDQVKDEQLKSLTRRPPKKGQSRLPSFFSL